MPKVNIDFDKDKYYGLNDERKHWNSQLIGRLIVFDRPLLSTDNERSLYEWIFVSFSDFYLIYQQTRNTKFSHQAWNHLWKLKTFVSFSIENENLKKQLWSLL